MCFGDFRFFKRAKANDNFRFFFFFLQEFMASSLSLTTLIPVSATVSRHLTFLTFAVNDEIDTRRPHGILKELSFDQFIEHVLHLLLLLLLNYFSWLLFFLFLLYNQKLHLLMYVLFFHFPCKIAIQLRRES